MVVRTDGSEYLSHYCNSLDIYECFYLKAIYMELKMTKEVISLRYYITRKFMVYADHLIGYCLASGIFESTIGWVYNYE
jgi:hypothetical protein